MAIAARPALRTQAFIDGGFRDAASGATFETENPATGEVIATVAAGGLTGSQGTGSQGTGS